MIEAYLVEVVTGVERGVAEEFEDAAVQVVGACARDDVGVSGSAVANFCMTPELDSTSCRI